MSFLQIDVDVIRVMQDSELITYLPKYGDRLALIAFVKTFDKPDCSKVTKDSLLKRIKTKTENYAGKKILSGNKHAEKDKRRVEVGWLDADLKNGSRLRQVKEPSGGGIRHDAFEVSTTMKHMQQVIIPWFFPNGKSRRGLASEYRFFMTDSSHTELSESITVRELYTNTKSKLLHLYLGSEKMYATDLQELSKPHKKNIHHVRHHFQGS